MRRLAAGVLAAMLAGCAANTVPPDRGHAYTPLAMGEPHPEPPAPPSVAPPGMQYLYGSGEAAAISVQAWRALLFYVADRVRKRPVDSVVLAEDATIAQPKYEPCGTKPYAAVFDVDETVLLNLGAEYDAARHPGPFDPKRWDAWERDGTQIEAVPGARAAIDGLRVLGVAVVFNSNRSTANAAQTSAALKHAGLGEAVHGETLFLKGDDNTGSLKDNRRWTIAERYCVIAMGGDQLGDFSDLFNEGDPGSGKRPTAAERRALAADPPFSVKWGNGWFALPNPVYGSALRGSVDDVFPPAARWAPEQEK